MNKEQAAQLAKTFSTTCKDAVEKSKAQTYRAPLILGAVMTVLLLTPTHGSGWGKITN